MCNIHPCRGVRIFVVSNLGSRDIKILVNVNTPFCTKELNLLSYLLVDKLVRFEDMVYQNISLVMYSICGNCCLPVYSRIVPSIHLLVHLLLLLLLSLNVANDILKTSIFLKDKRHL